MPGITAGGGAMILIVWRYEVDPAHDAAFRAFYRPDGDWAHLFARGEGFVGVELGREGEDSYITIDRWQSAAHFDAFLARFRHEYEALDQCAAGWTRGEEFVGRYEQVE
jgi:heme-degrading monooxygenase HmoA